MPSDGYGALTVAPRCDLPRAMRVTRQVPEANKEQTGVVEEVEAKLRAMMLASLSGDRDSYRQLLRSSAERIGSYFRRRLGRGDPEVEDLVQETLIAIHQRRFSYDPLLPYTAWLHAIARYKLIDHLRKRGRTKVEHAPDPDEFPGSDTIAPSLAGRDVEALLARIPAKHRIAIQLTRIGGYSVAEAAALSGQSESAIKIGVHRGMQKLTALLRAFDSR